MCMSYRMLLYMHDTHVVMHYKAQVFSGRFSATLQAFSQITQRSYDEFRVALKRTPYFSDCM